MADYISLDDARTFLGIQDGADESELMDAVTAATQACIDWMNRDVAAATYTEVLHGRGGAVLPVNNFPITALSALSIDDIAQPLADFRFKDAFVYRKSGTFPFGRMNISVTYTAGAASVPAPVKRAVLYTLKAMWDARLTDMNSTGEQYPGIISAQFWQAGPGAVPPQAAALLNNSAKRFAV